MVRKPSRPATASSRPRRTTTPQREPETAPTQPPTAGPQPETASAFVMNLGGIEDPTGYELATGYHLRRAAPGEAAQISRILPTMPTAGIPMHRFLWPEDNNYFVIERQGDLQPAPLHPALDLAPTELEIGFVFGPGLTWQPDRFYQVLRQMYDGGPSTLVQLAKCPRRRNSTNP
jgi:hypothetical protein